MSAASRRWRGGLPAAGRDGPGDGRAGRRAAVRWMSLRRVSLRRVSLRRVPPRGETGWRGWY